jgi:hypothetical protein
MNAKLFLKSLTPNSKSLVALRFRASALIISLGLCLLAVACDGKDSISDEVDWSLDGSAVVLVSPNDRSELLIGRWPYPGWQRLKTAKPGFEFYHPLWLLDNENLPLIAAVELRVSGKESDTSDTLLRLFDPDRGKSLDALSLAATAQLHALDDIICLASGTGRRTLIFAGKLQRDYVVEEWDITSLAVRRVLSSCADDFDILVSRDGQYMATIESPLLSAGSYHSVSRLAITPTQVAWAGPLANWELPLNGGIYSQPAGQVKLLSWSPDGMWLAARTREATDRLIIFRPLDGFMHQVFQGKDIGDVTWTPDSRQIAFLARAAGQFESARKLWIYDFSQDRAISIAISPEVRPAGWAMLNRALLLLGSGNGQTELGILELSSRRQSKVLREDGEAYLIQSPDCTLGIWLSKNNSPTWIQF